MCPQRDEIKEKMFLMKKVGPGKGWGWGEDVGRIKCSLKRK
jgi:hypothetical protein